MAPHVSLCKRERGPLGPDPEHQIGPHDAARHVTVEHEGKPAEHLSLRDADVTRQHTPDALRKLLVVGHRKYLPSLPPQPMPPAHYERSAEGGTRRMSKRALHAHCLASGSRHLLASSPSPASSVSARPRLEPRPVRKRPHSIPTAVWEPGSTSTTPASRADPEGAVAAIGRSQRPHRLPRDVELQPGCPIRRPALVARFLEAAHAQGLAVVAWYLPGFLDVARDVRRSLAAITFRTASGHSSTASGWTSSLRRSDPRSYGRAVCCASRPNFAKPSAPTTASVPSSPRRAVSSSRRRPGPASPTKASQSNSTSSYR